MALGVVAQQGNERARALAEDIRSTVIEDGVDVWLDRVTAESLGHSGYDVTELGNCELVASIGGDGTFLFTARSVGTTPIVGINLGEVGFLNAVAPGEATSVVRELYAQAVTEELPTQVLPRVLAMGDSWELGPALNEIIVHSPQRGVEPGISIEVKVDGQTYNSDRADGVMVATPTGSTAYNLSEGGPLLTPDLPGLVITEMSGRNPRPPVVVPADSTITIHVNGPEYAAVISDGRLRKRLSIPTVINVERASMPVRVAGPPVAFFDALDKLK